jgi:DNA primase
MIAARRPLFEFAIKQKLANFDLDALEGRVSAARAAAAIVAGIKDSVVQSAYVRELAGWTNLDSNEVAGFVKSAASASRSESVSNLRINEGPDTAPPALDQGGQSEFGAVSLADPVNRMERTTLEVLVQAPTALPFAVLQRISSAGFAAPAHAEIGRAITMCLAADGSVLEQGQAQYLRAIAAILPTELHDLLREIAATGLPARDETGLAAYAEGVMIRALDNVLNREKNALLARLRRLDPSVEADAYRAVQTELMAIETQRRSLR